MRLLADENLHGAIVRGVLRRRPGTDIVRVQDVGLRGAEDGAILAWAASEDRVIVTHDVATMIDLAYARVERGERMPGLLAVSASSSLGAVIDDIVLLLSCSGPDEWASRVLFVPLA